MSSGELLTRGTVWAAIAAYTCGSVIFALAGKRLRWDAAARVLWTIGCLSLLAHFACAFQFYHSWSHQAAYEETARQTKSVTGLNWGGGLFINYALLVAWVVEVGGWWWRGLRCYRERPWFLPAIFHGFVIFMIFNATVVFKAGIVRELGLGISAILCASWVWFAKQRQGHFGSLW